MKARLELCLQSRAFPLLLVGGLAVAQLLAFPGHYLGQEHDDAQYVLAARSIARAEYGLGISPGNPRLTFVTPGWPLLLAPAAWLFGDARVGSQFWAYLWLVLCDILVWLWFRRRAPPAAAAAATCIFGLNPLILTRSGVVMSEIPALAATLGLLLLLDCLPSWAAGLWAGAAWLIRPAALPLFAAIPGYYLWKRKPRAAALCLAAGAAPVMAWKAWVSSAGAQLSEFEELALNSPRGVWALLSMAASNIRQAVSLWGQSALPWASTATGPCLVLGSALALAAAVGLWRQRIHKDYEPAAVFLLAGALLHALWPWWYERYLVAFLPFLVWAVWKSFWDIGEAKATALLWILALSPLAAQSLPIMRSVADCSRPDLAETYAWIRGHTNPWDAFASAFYCTDALYAGRPFMPLPPSPKDGSGSYADALRRRRTKYVLWAPVPDLGSSRGADYFWSRRLEDVKERLSQPAFFKIYSNALEKTEVYSVKRK